MGWGNYWKDVCAPRLKAAKLASGKKDAEIMAAVNEEVPRSAKRQQVNHWFTGTREPTVQQFLAVCDEIKADPIEILNLYGVKSATPFVGRSLTGSTAEPTVEHNNNKSGGGGRRGPAEKHIKVPTQRAYARQGHSVPQARQRSGRKKPKASTR